MYLLSVYFSIYQMQCVYP